MNNFLGQQPRPEWEKQWPDYIIAAFDLWRGGSRGYGAIDPAPFEQAAGGKR